MAWPGWFRSKDIQTKPEVAPQPEITVPAVDGMYVGAPIMFSGKAFRLVTVTSYAGGSMEKPTTEMIFKSL